MPMSTATPIYTLLVAAKSGTSNAARVARAIGATADDVWATVDVAWERGEIAVSNTLTRVAGELAVRA